MEHGLIVSGKVLEVEHRKGSFTPDDGQNAGQAIAYDFRLCHVLAGRQVHQVRFQPDGPVEPPAHDVEVRILVTNRGGKLIATGYVDDAATAAVRKIG